MRQRETPGIEACATSGGSALSLLLTFSVLLFACLTGCGSPNKANVELRRQNQDLEGKVAALQQQSETAQAEIRGLREKQGSLPTLSPDRLAKLFTTSAVKLGRLTGGSDFDPKKPGEDGLKVYLTPYDQNGDKFKAAGSFEIEAFDLDVNESNRLGRWTFEPVEAAKHWVSFLTEYNYSLPCPWQERRPSGNQVTIRVTFTDELTGRKFPQQTVGKVQPKVQDQPAAPATTGATKK